MASRPCLLLKTPEDILLLIMGSLDSLETLLLFSSCCSRTYELFKGYPNQLCKSVTTNFLGIYADYRPLQDPKNYEVSHIVDQARRISAVFEMARRTTLWLTATAEFKFDLESKNHEAETLHCYHSTSSPMRPIYAGHSHLVLRALLAIYRQFHAESVFNMDWRPSEFPPVAEWEKMCSRRTRAAVVKNMRCLRVYRGDRRRFAPNHSRTPPSTAGCFTSCEIWEMLRDSYMQPIMAAEIVGPKEPELDVSSIDKMTGVRLDECRHFPGVS